MGVETMLMASVGGSVLSSIGSGIAGQGASKVAAAQAKAQAAYQYNQATRQEYSQLQDLTAYNAAALEVNRKNQVRANVKSALLSLQEAQAAKASAQERFLIGSQKEQVMGSVNANQAASGTVGASTVAVQSDVERTMQQAEAKNRENWQITAQNFMTQAQDIAWGLEDSFVSGKNANTVQEAQEGVTITPAATSTGAIIGSSIMGGLTQYFGAKMQLGLSKTG